MYDLKISLILCSRLNELSELSGFLSGENVQFINNMPLYFFKLAVQTGKLVNDMHHFDRPVKTGLMYRS